MLQELPQITECYKELAAKLLYMFDGFAHPQDIQLQTDELILEVCGEQVLKEIKQFEEECGIESVAPSSRPSSPSKKAGKNKPQIQQGRPLEKTEWQLSPESLQQLRINAQELEQFSFQDDLSKVLSDHGTKETSIQLSSLNTAIHQKIIDQFDTAIMQLADWKKNEFKRQYQVTKKIDQAYSILQQEWEQKQLNLTNCERDNIYLLQYQ
eukprot:TRINITY_DN5663_c0_g1_i1.p1 TRINITY_DN5663_c0_g1~~TRINITY_DN5663_c0_g1_i1.p1  ORF type:complete len:219 (-),score=18.64 TRINITY_DN5663_c0_g1_i1:638-1267(-)